MQKLLDAVDGLDADVVVTTGPSIDPATLRSPANATVCQRADQLPKAVLDRGWAALCFDDDPVCIGTMKRIAAPAPRLVVSQLAARSTLLRLS